MSDQHNRRGYTPTLAELLEHLAEYPSDRHDARTIKYGAIDALSFEPQALADSGAAK